MIIFLQIQFNIINLCVIIFQRIAGTFGTRKMSTDTQTVMSAKEKLKKAVKEYGSTVIVFHISISLLSLGACYVLVSRYVKLSALSATIAC